MSIKERIAELEKQVHIHQDNQDIKWAKNGNYILPVVQHSPVVSEGNSEAGDTYEGMFKCTQGENEGEVVISEGVAQVNAEIIWGGGGTVVVGTDGYIIFEAFYNNGNIEHAVKFTTDFEYTPNYARIILATVTVDQSTISIIQQHFGSIQVYIFSDCGSSD